MGREYRFKLVLYRVVRKKVTESLTSEQTDEGGSHVDICRKSVSGRRSSMRKGPEAGL